MSEDHNKKNEIDERTLYARHLSLALRVVVVTMKGTNRRRGGGDGLEHLPLLETRAEGPCWQRKG